ncbi:MAG: abortive phage resistance protein, partial [Desulfovibrio sp.]|nr:abortive phage resistance protein [Desulfovibrio sp.]
FGKLYDDIFIGLNAAQAILATVIFKEVDNKRKLSPFSEKTPFIPYASHYIAMLCGRELLKNNSLSCDEITHKNFQTLLASFEQGKERYIATAVEQIKQALVHCYGERTVSLQQLSATFRRGDLLEMLQ